MPKIKNKRRNKNIPLINNITMILHQRHILLYTLFSILAESSWAWTSQSSSLLTTTKSFTITKRLSFSIYPHSSILPKSTTTTTQQSRSRICKMSSTSITDDTNNGGSSSFTNNNNNIVLRPSSNNQESFDSFKIGSPCVHRYARDSSMDPSDIEYVMWYHGRSSANNTNVDDNDDEESILLPPLSTGRIGRAISKNGLQWEKSSNFDLGASRAEDTDDVSLGLNMESWWSFDTAHVGLGQVLLPMSNPAVITDGGVYLMYYMGGNLEETDLSLYMESSTTNNAAPPPETKIQGMKMRIGVALSQDGITWGRIEGDDPTGACMVPYEKSDPSTKGDIDTASTVWKVEEELYCAWPDVFVNTNTNKKLFGGKEQQPFHMYYSTMTKDGKEKAIARAVSDDGFRWYKRGVCLRPGGSGNGDTNDDNLDTAGCARSIVFKEIEFDQVKGNWESVPKLDAPWIMYYEGVSSVDRKHRILKAESEDGITWVKKGIVFDVGDGWDCNGVSSPHILRMDDGTVRMYYTGLGENGSTAIGVARAGDDGVFVREQAEFAFA